MLQRTITGVVALAIFLVVLYLLPPVCTVVMFCLLCAVAAHELVNAVGAFKGHPLRWATCAAAALVPLVTANGNAALAGFTGLVFGYVFLAFVWAIFDNQRVRFEELSYGFFGGLLIPYMLTSVLRIYRSDAELGQYLVLLPFIAAWACDSLAYTVGVFFGKHKLAPAVSPKKTIEGSLGGLLGGAGGVVLMGYILTTLGDVTVQYLPLALVGAAAAVAGQLGDLSMSLIKRNVGIKDYGKLFPGHGGVLDRFDSVLFTAPIFEMILIFTEILKVG